MTAGEASEGLDRILLVPAPIVKYPFVPMYKLVDDVAFVENATGNVIGVVEYPSSMLVHAPVYCVYPVVVGHDNVVELNE